MAYHDIAGILRNIDNVLEVATVDEKDGVETVTSTHRSDLARPLAEATGLNTIVVRGDENESGYEGALRAARAAAAAFLPGVALEDLRNVSPQDGGSE